MKVDDYLKYLESSIERSTRWAVFEPNNEALWAKIRQTVTEFLYKEWYGGALRGARPEEAFFVHCDRSTMTQNDLDNGRLICQIGVALVKPAEFVIFSISQITGQKPIDHDDQDDFRRHPDHPRKDDDVDERHVPHAGFNFIIKFEDGSETFARFSDVSRPGSEFTAAENRTGKEPKKHVRKLPGTHKAADVTLKRGVINSGSLWEWLNQARDGGGLAKKQVLITLVDEARNPVRTWTLSGCLPLKYTGPVLNGKGGGEVAIEELVLTFESLEPDD